MEGKALTCLWLRGKLALRHTAALSGQTGRVSQHSPELNGGGGNT